MLNTSFYIASTQYEPPKTKYINYINLVDHRGSCLCVLGTHMATVGPGAPVEGGALAP